MRIIFLSVLVMTLPLTAYSVVGGGEKNHFEVKSEEDGDVYFKHSTHVGKDLGPKKMRITCKDCHVKYYIGPEARKKVVSMEEMEKGKSCGACHDGIRAFSAEANCEKCHDEKK
jgi:c(7)-type cytochrome triheme protein